MQTLATASLNNAAADSLEAFIALFNQQQAQHDAMAEQIETLTAKLADSHHHQNRAEGLANENAVLQAKIDEQGEVLLVAKQVADAKIQLAKENEKQGRRLQELERELTMSRQRANALQKEITTLKSTGNPEKLKKQNQRLKDKNQELTAKNDRLQRENRAYRQDKEKIGVQYNEALDKIRMMRAAGGDLPGIYHNGDHHLIAWPKRVPTQNIDTGETHESVALLHMHQSGTARLITYNEETGNIVIHKAPAGGVKLTKDVQQFAEDWLFHVNVTQGGNLTPDDVRQTNLNTAA